MKAPKTKAAAKNAKEILKEEEESNDPAGDEPNGDDEDDDDEGFRPEGWPDGSGDDDDDDDRSKGKSDDEQEPGEEDADSSDPDLFQGKYSRSKADTPQAKTQTTETLLQKLNPQIQKQAQGIEQSVLKSLPQDIPL